MTRLLPLLLLLAAAAPARAEPCTRAVYVDAGTVAPCTGDLLPTSEVLRLLLAEDALVLTRAELTRERELAVILSEEAGQLLAVDRDARRECEEVAAPPPPTPRRWYQSPWFAGVIGAVVGSAIAITVYAGVKHE